MASPGHFHRIVEVFELARAKVLRRPSIPPLKVVSSPVDVRRTPAKMRKSTTNMAPLTMTRRRLALKKAVRVGIVVEQIECSLRAGKEENGEAEQQVLPVEYGLETVGGSPD